MRRDFDHVPQYNYVYFMQQKFALNILIAV
jgi:hypothetical protein